MLGSGKEEDVLTRHLLKETSEQCLESNSLIYINFQKAFDSLHHETLWKILRSYGPPSKIVTLIGLFNYHFECSVIWDRKL